MALKYLVFGARGQLGGDLVDEGARQNHEMVGLTQVECDIRDGRAVERWLSSVRPDAVINAAAWTRVDAAEDHEAEAEAVNATGAGIVASACAAAGVRCCHVSTDYVFDGTATSPIPEDAVPAPRSAYGRTKWHGEVAVRESCADHLIVRTGWLYGREGPNFVLTMLRLAAERPRLRVVADQHGAPTWTGHLAPAMLRLLEVGPPGTYHLSNHGSTTWYDLAVATIRARGLPVEVVPIATAEYPTPAARPAYSVLDNRAWRDLGEPPLPEWDEGLLAYLASRDAVTR
ncbi:MAG TPA: dTDP-4-dehydrorhamnose reductase [Candidatus Saccharimonadales bacterium]|nr:dTDP-4-dehydrorhamnose reductase [Candidatus Saccharimonadales bacterium]